MRSSPESPNRCRTGEASNTADPEARREPKSLHTSVRIPIPRTKAQSNKTTTALGRFHDFAGRPGLSLLGVKLPVGCGLPGPTFRVGTFGMGSRGLNSEADLAIDGAVCVIDGDGGIRNSLFMLIGALGFRAATFPSAEAFLERLQDQKPCFLITELSLPGMSGLELKRVLNERRISIPTIGLTTEADPVHDLEAIRLGFLELVEKPIVYWTVVERVRQTVGVVG
jgi:CheY-like chemotaxis protein